MFYSHGDFESRIRLEKKNPETKQNKTKPDLQFWNVTILKYNCLAFSWSSCSSVTNCCTQNSKKFFIVCLSSFYFPFYLWLFNLRVLLFLRDCIFLVLTHTHTPTQYTPPPKTPYMRKSPLKKNFTMNRVKSAIKILGDKIFISNPSRRTSELKQQKSKSKKTPVFFQFPVLSKCCYLWSIEICFRMGTQKLWLDSSQLWI